VSAPVHVVHIIDSLAPGGAESSLAAMAPALVSRGVRLDVIALTARPGLQDALRNAGATVTELDGSRLTWWQQIHALVRERRPALVHTTLFEADLAGRVGARLAGTPVVSTLTNDTYGAAHRSEHRTRHHRLRAAQLSDAVTARLATRLHSVSAHVADVMARRLRYPRARIDVIPRGRDPDVLGRLTRERRDRARDGLGIPPDAPLVIAVARQEHQKGLDVLIEALPRVLHEVPVARVVIAGRPGNATASLHEQLLRIDGAKALEFLGARSDVADLLCASDVFVLPSRWEGLPGALLEAMALECPAVVSDLPQIREVVDDATALLVPPEDPRALGTAVVRALSSTTGARRRAVAARRRFIERFTIDAIADQMIAFYRRALLRP
jgi:glycosyltransferase involved in cell wall biosynthesis